MQRTRYLLASKLRPRRSTMYVPGINTKALAKIRATLPCDSFIIDLEDAVASNAKQQARDTVQHFLSTTINTPRTLHHRELMVRINALDTPWGLADLTMVSASPSVDTIAIPKVETASDVWRVERHLEELTRNGTCNTTYSNDTTPFGLACMIETPLGVLNAAEIAAASTNVVCLIMGTSDLTNDLKAHHTTNREPMLTSLGMCVLAARAHGVAVLDGVHLNLSDMDEFAAHCEQGYNMGFDGKTLIHPKQISKTNDTYGVNENEINRARHIVTAFEAAERQGEGVCVVDGQLIENLHAEGARRVLEFAKQISIVEQSS